MLSRNCELAQVDDQPPGLVVDRARHAIAQLGGVRSIDLAGEVRHQQSCDRFEPQIGERNHGHRVNPCTIADTLAPAFRNPEDQKDDVVARLACAGAQHRLLKPAGDLGRAAARAGLEGRHQTRALHDPTGGIGVGQPIGVEDQGVSGGETRGLVRQLGVGQHAEHGAGLAHRLDPSISAQHEGQRVSAHRHGHLGAVRPVDVESPTGHRAGLVGRLAPDRVVQQPQDAARPAFGDRGGAQRVAGEPGGGCRGRSLAENVTDHHGPAPVIAREQVVEVASHEVLLCRRLGSRPRSRSRG